MTVGSAAASDECAGAAGTASIVNPVSAIPVTLSMQTQCTFMWALLTETIDADN